MILCVLIFTITLPAEASELTAPPVPESGQELMPETTAFGNGLLDMLEHAMRKLNPDLEEALKVMVSLIAAVLTVGLIQSVNGGVQELSELAGALCISVSMFSGANSMIALGAQTITAITEYGKLLLPVMTAALAAQGGITASSALYAGTAMFNALLSSMLSGVLVPCVYLFLMISAANAMTSEGLLKNMRDLVKSSMSWLLKTILTVFTTYMTITGVISGTTDAAALKATKVTISSVVPVVGGILSDASESVLVSAGLAKNAAGIYGIFAVLAVFLTPFLQIGVHYLMLKLTCGLCTVFGPKRMTDLIGDYSAAMGLLLSMTGSACLLQLISTVCFLKGVG